MARIKVVISFISVLLLLYSCGSSIRFSQMDEKAFLASVATFPDDLKGDICEDLDRLAFIYQSAIYQGLDPARHLNLEIAFLETLLRNFDFDASIKRVENVRYTKDTRSDLDNGYEVRSSSNSRVRRDPSIGEYLRAFLGDCITEGKRVETMIDMALTIYNKYKGLPLALASNQTLSSTGLIEKDTLSHFRKCFSEIDEFNLSTVKNYLKNMDLRKTANQIGEELEGLAELAPQCLLDMIGLEHDEGQVSPACETRFGLVTFDPTTGGGPNYNLPETWEWDFQHELTVDLSGIYVDPVTGGRLMPHVTINHFAHDLSEVAVLYCTSDLGCQEINPNEFGIVVNPGDYFDSYCRRGNTNHRRVNISSR